MPIPFGLHHGDALKLLKCIPDESIDLIVADPPYNVSQKNNLETMGRRGIEFLWDGKFDQTCWLRDGVRVLKKGGTFISFNDWRNLGEISKALRLLGMNDKRDLYWYKCLAGSTQVYVRSRRGISIMSIKDLARLKCADVWNGKRWTKVLHVVESAQPDSPLEIELESGEALKCTSNHKWPTSRGVLEASQLKVGDVLSGVKLPDTPQSHVGEVIDDYIGWFIGIYLAEGSKGGHKKSPKVQISCHVDEIEEFLPTLSYLAETFHGKAKAYETTGNAATINLTGKLVNALIDTFVAGDNCYTKRLKSTVWSRSDAFLEKVMTGYLDGDGHYDASNDRYRLRFTGKNKALESNLRTLSARLGGTIKLSKSTASGFGKIYPAYVGSFRWARPTRGNARIDTKIVAIKPCRWAGKFWDISVEDDPHLFALASGVLTHNSNPMPRNKNRLPVQRMESAIYAVKPGDKWTFNLGAAPIKLKSCCKPYLTQNDKYCAKCGRRVAPKGYEDGIFYHSIQKDFLHPTKKPDALWEDIIRVFSNPGDTVLDPFAGVGTLAVAAAKSGRNQISFDNDYFYVMWGRHRLRQVLATQ